MSIIIYSTEWCVPCKNAKQLLDDKNVIYKEIDIEKNDMSREDLYDVTGGRTVPQIIINEKDYDFFILNAFLESNECCYKE